MTTHETDKDALVKKLSSRYQAALEKRRNWEGLWQDCYDYAFPQRDGAISNVQAGERKTDRLYDATAVDAADHLASSLLSQLTPPWSNWFGLKPGPDMSDEDAQALAPLLEKTTQIMRAHFERSNFAVEIHQCYLDLVTVGTASLYFREEQPGKFSAFRFSAVPLGEVVLEEGGSGTLETTYRRTALSLNDIKARFPSSLNMIEATLSQKVDPDERFDVLEAVTPDGLMYVYRAVLNNEQGEDVILSEGRFSTPPFINFRWQKAPGEIYGRSPVMKALPDIKTANKVVELILKNASIAVTGIWQADDDGVLNPANISLTPGSIIPKAVGSQGLKALDMPGQFDVSQLVLKDLRSRIRHSMLADSLAQINERRMTATEVMERAAEMERILGATYGRLQNELLTPLILRAFHILRRRGEVPDITIDGRLVELDYRSPLARAQGRRDVQNTLSWIDSVSAMGGEAAASVDLSAAAQFVADALGVPSHLVKRDITPIEIIPPQIAKGDIT